jgi:hypothetical protein
MGDDKDRTFEMRAREVGSLQICAREADIFEMRVTEQGSFEVHVPEGGCFEMHVLEVCSAKIRSPKVKMPTLACFPLSVRFVASTNHR